MFVYNFQRLSSRKWIFLYILAIFDGLVCITGQVFGQPGSNYNNGQTTTYGPEEVSQIITDIFGNGGDTNPPQNACNCTPLNMCQKHNNSTINTSGDGLIDIRLGQCENSLDICCDEVRTPEKVPNLKPYIRTNSCGKRNENGVGFRITPGNMEAQFGEFPWTVALLGKKYEDNVEFYQYHCGGSLIHLRVVLTAAHCVYSYVTKPQELLVRAGEWDSKSEDETIPYQQRTAEKIVIHKSYSSGSLYNDIALVFLKEDFEFAENVDFVCLPTHNENVDNANCVACGWGKESFGSTVYQNILKSVNLPIVPRDQCQYQLTTTKLGPRFKLHESFLCAGGNPGVDTCKGDGGSPLMCPIPGRPDHYQQVGIVAWGIGCGNAIPGVYVNVPYLRNWVDEKFAEHNLPISSYVYENKRPNTLFPSSFYAA